MDLFRLSFLVKLHYTNLAFLVKSLIRLWKKCSSKAVKRSASVCLRKKSIETRSIHKAIVFSFPIAGMFFKVYVLLIVKT